MWEDGSMDNLDLRSACEAKETHPRACGPDQLAKLQRIFDQVWMELRANGTVSGPRYPDTLHGKIARRALRYETGRQVMSYADNHQMTDGEITQAIVKRMSITYRSEPAPSAQLR